jgi:hypothetical protein
MRSAFGRAHAKHLRAPNPQPAEQKSFRFESNIGQPIHEVVLSTNNSARGQDISKNQVPLCSAVTERRADTAFRRVTLS